MIRTEVVTLTTIPARAYRLKLPAGGSGIVIMRNDADQPGLATISKTSGEPVAARNNPARIYPKKAFKEAMELTAGFPYKKRNAPPKFAPLPGKKAADEPVLEVIVDGDDYRKIVEKYTDKKGKLSYALLNKDLIRFAHSSSVVRGMIEKKDSLESIRLYIAGTKFRAITGDKDLTDDQVVRIAELLDEVSPAGVFKELNDELRRKLA